MCYIFCAVATFIVVNHLTLEQKHKEVTNSAGEGRGQKLILTRPAPDPFLARARLCRRPAFAGGHHKLV
jgi:hypothetical protein